MRAPLPDLSGQRFGHWIVEQEIPRERRSVAKHYRCRCEPCGRTKILRQDSLRSGRSKSCGCIRAIGSQWTLDQHRASKRKWKSLQPNYRARESRRWREMDPERAKHYRRKTNYRIKYGIELEDVESLWKAQDCKCAICLCPIILGGKAGAKVDHCHATGVVRGILCSTCNTGIGSLGDSPTRLRAAALYLEQKTRSF